MIGRIGNTPKICKHAASIKPGPIHYVHNGYHESLKYNTAAEETPVRSDVSPMLY